MIKVYIIALSFEDIFLGFKWSLWIGDTKIARTWDSVYTHSNHQFKQGMYRRHCV